MWSRPIIVVTPFGQESVEMFLRPRYQKIQALQACGAGESHPKTRFSSCRYSRIFCCSWFSQPARSETRKIGGETNGLIASIVADVTYGCRR